MKSNDRTYSDKSRYKQLLGVSGETRVLFDVLSRGERYLASRFRLGKFGEIDLVTLGSSGAVYCYEVRTIGPNSRNRYIFDQYNRRKVLKVRNTARLFEMYHVKQFIGIGIGVYSPSKGEFEIKLDGQFPVIPILASVTGETDINRGVNWNISYFDIEGNLLSK